VIDASIQLGLLYSLVPEALGCSGSSNTATINYVKVVLVSPLEFLLDCIQQSYSWGAEQVGNSSSNQILFPLLSSEKMFDALC
jgi:hypothetical protein